MKYTRLRLLVEAKVTEVTKVTDSKSFETKGNSLFARIAPNKTKPLVEILLAIYFNDRSEICWNLEDLSDRNATTQFPTSGWGWIDHLNFIRLMRSDRDKKRSFVVLESLKTTSQPPKGRSLLINVDQKENQPGEFNFSRWLGEGNWSIADFRNEPDAVIAAETNFRPIPNDSERRGLMLSREGGDFGIQTRSDGEFRLQYAGSAMTSSLRRVMNIPGNLVRIAAVGTTALINPGNQIYKNVTKLPNQKALTKEDLTGPCLWADAKTVGATLGWSVPGIFLGLDARYVSNPQLLPLLLTSFRAFIPAQLDAELNAGLPICYQGIVKAMA